MTKEERKQKKKVHQMIQRFHSTVDFLDIDYVAENFISIGNESVMLVGLKLIPPKIVLADQETKLGWITNLSLVLNSCDLKLYHSVVTAPINVSLDVMRLDEKMEKCNNPKIKRLYQNEIELLMETSMNQQVEFFIMGRGKFQDEKFLKKFDDLFRKFKSNGFQVVPLNKRDFENYIAFAFKNKYIYDFYFSHGVFESLPQHDERAVFGEEGENYGKTD